MKVITLKISAITMLLMMCNYMVSGQCASPSNIYSFEYDGKLYEIIKENKSWANAAICAVERGAILTEINDASEQDAIFQELTTNAGIDVNNTIAPDGGGGSYVWIGGNDLVEEGVWIWDGDNDFIGVQFWMGDTSGGPVGGLYNNWGDEPDDFQGQDALGLSLNGWPLGVAGEWNDVDHTNTLYYVVEHPLLGIEDDNFNKTIKLSPNPVVDYVTIEASQGNLQRMVIYNSLGQELRTIDLDKSAASKTINLSNLNSGIYFIQISSQDGKSTIKKIIR